MTVDEADRYTIFVVDDDAAVARAIARLLRADGWRVTTFGSAEAFLADYAAAPGCLVLDVDLPGLDGLGLQQRLRDAGETLPIVFLTGYGDIPMSVRAIKAGAADFLTKPVEGDALNAAIRAAIEQHAAHRHGRTDGVEYRRRLETLTPREREVLAAVVAGKLNKQIAFDLGIVEQTVKYHRARIMERMRAKSVAELMHIVARADARDAP
ncbi:MAG TPA: response regulator [Pseudomonadales bacterium]|jgi:FixJ family two-component response regulator|nr:response regulator [Pseudomonadales bacterium]